MRADLLEDQVGRDLPDDVKNVLITVKGMKGERAAEGEGRARKSEGWVSSDAARWSGVTVATYKDHERDIVLAEGRKEKRSGMPRREEGRQRRTISEPITPSRAGNLPRMHCRLPSDQ